ncbi:MAG: hypothetical protein QME12_04690 [Nanoarchaeota archaeon]|nr:hypothetical protein [Nanoarchaeota archaeon]
MGKMRAEARKRKRTKEKRNRRLSERKMSFQAKKHLPGISWKRLD